MNWRTVRTAAVTVVALLALVASTHGSGSSPSQSDDPPLVAIDTPTTRAVMVRTPSFEIGGAFSGSVTTIEVSIDGQDVGPALRGEEADRWRLPATRVSLTPGLHEIVVSATGEHGIDDDSIHVFYETDPGVLFELRLVPDAASYVHGDTFFDDPELLLLAPDGVEIDIALTADAPAGFAASINALLRPGDLASVSLGTSSSADPPPGDYPIVVRGVSDGFEREATHLLTITGPPPSTTGPPATAAPSTTEVDATTRVLFDDFEGPDLWTATTGGSDGTTATAELASGGNPGGQRRMTHVLPGTSDGEGNPTRISVTHVYTGGGWDPAVDGPLASVSFSEDQIEHDPPFAGAAVGTLLVIMQDGTRYTASLNENNAFSNTAWQTVRAEALTPADFSPAPGPDFSATGGAMSFGFFRSNTHRGTDAIVTQHGLDNWTVELVPAD